LFPHLTTRVIIPGAVATELETGRKLGIDLPDPKTLDWIEIKSPASEPVLPLITDLGPGETEVLALALETEDPLVIMDDGPARRMAETLGIKLTGTLGLLIDAKRSGLIPAVAPVLDQLEALRFRLAAQTPNAVLLAGERS